MPAAGPFENIQLLYLRRNDSSYTTMTRERRKLRQVPTFLVIIAALILVYSPFFGLLSNYPDIIGVYAYIPNRRRSAIRKNAYKITNIIVSSSSNTHEQIDFIASERIDKIINATNSSYDDSAKNESLHHSNVSSYYNPKNFFHMNTNDDNINDVQTNSSVIPLIENGENVVSTYNGYNKDDIRILAKILSDNNAILSDEYSIIHDTEISSQSGNGSRYKNTSVENLWIQEESPKFIDCSIEGRKQMQENIVEKEVKLGKEVLSTNKTSTSRMKGTFTRIKRILSRSSRNIYNKTELLNGTTDDDTEDSNNTVDNDYKPSLRRLWRRRHARTLEEGIRRERTNKLSSLMNRALIDVRKDHEKNYVERLLMGLINGLAEEIEDLDIEVTTIKETPLWRKEVEEIRINFSRLGFRPIRIGGTNSIQLLDKNDLNESITEFNKEEERNGDITELTFVECADEGFDRIDEDNSGTLDSDELAHALKSISGLKPDQNSIEELATDLVRLYDINGDGVVDREEYKQMVDDMAKLRGDVDADDDDNDEKGMKNNPFNAVKDSIQTVSQGISKKAAEVATVSQGISRKAVQIASAARDNLLSGKQGEDINETEMGSIVLSKVNLDLRRLVFGALPVVKKITPGGPLILEPFTATVTASFSREDVMESFFVDAALKRLVARALRVRVRSFRDLVDGALFFGRQWKMTCETAPVVEVLGFSNVEFDSRDKLIITGRARIRTSPDAPVVTNTFKLRTKIGTRKNGQVIKLVEPELAFVFECPSTLEKGLNAVYGAMGLKPPERPDPYYSFFPIYSPFKVDDDTGGFDMGEDNCIRSIYILNGKLRFEMSVVLRPGRFLGNHYLAFTVPQRTFIITMDRVWNGVREARENKKAADCAKQLKDMEKTAASAGTDESMIESSSVSSSSDIVVSLTPSSVVSPVSSLQAASTTENEVSTPRSRLIKTIKSSAPKPKAFHARFVEGYTMAQRKGEASNKRLTNTISDWFGRQGRGNVTSSTTTKDKPE